MFDWLSKDYPRPVAWVLNDKCKCLSDEQIYQKGKSIALLLVEKYYQFLYLVNVYRIQRAIGWVLNDKCKCLIDEKIYQKGKTIALLLVWK